MAKAAEAKPETPARVAPKELTFKDDKRAQYARLVITNYVRANAKKFGVKADVVNVDSITNATLLKAGKEIVEGNYLTGPSGIEFIQEHSANGSTTGRALTTAYASEVRPFIRKLIVAEKFGRRGGLTDEEKAEREEKRQADIAKRKAEVEERKAEREKKAAEAKAKREAEAKAKAEEARAKKEAREKEQAEKDKAVLAKAQAEVEEQAKAAS